MGTTEPCVKCNRVDCPTFTMPALWGKPYHGAGFSVQTQLPGAAKVRRAAMKDCRAHAVDWRRRALEAEARERWVPVGERLPEVGTVVLVTWFYARKWWTYTACYNNGFWLWDDDEDGWTVHDGDLVTHWRPMPAAPEVNP